jgi:hypothetical protein
MQTPKRRKQPAAEPLCLHSRCNAGWRLSAPLPDWMVGRKNPAMHWQDQSRGCMVQCSRGGTRSATGSSQRCNEGSEMISNTWCRPLL